MLAGCHEVTIRWRTVRLRQPKDFACAPALANPRLPLPHPVALHLAPATASCSIDLLSRSPKLCPAAEDPQPCTPTASRYREYWTRVAALKAPLVSITSYNEWGEGTQIEPAVSREARVGCEYLDYEPLGPYMYLQMTKQGAAQLGQACKADAEGEGNGGGAVRAEEGRGQEGQGEGEGGSGGGRAGAGQEEQERERERVEGGSQGAGEGEHEEL